MKARRQRRIGHLLCWLAVGSTALSAPANGGLDGTLQELLAAEKVKLSIAVLSPWRLFKSPLHPAVFEEYLRDSGPDYLLEVHGTARGKRILEILAAAEFQGMDAPTTKLDLRYRVTIDADGRPTVVIYADAHGTLVYEGKVFDAEATDRWLPRFWELLVDDMVFTKKPGDTALPAKVKAKK